MKIFKKIKKTHDGRAMLNIGCGLRTHREWNNLDFSPYAQFAKHKKFAGFLHAIGILSQLRYQNILQMDPDIIHWDLRFGIPFEDNTMNVIYHSHFIAHVDRHDAVKLTLECYRVLKSGGILRVVVPDLQKIIKLYNQAVVELERGIAGGRAKHIQALDELFELMVRKEAKGTSCQNLFVRLIERIVRGDITKRGELRSWHYDKYSMGAMLTDGGFQNIKVVAPNESSIEGWSTFGLDLNKDGSVYKPGSLYMEGSRLES